MAAHLAEDLGVSTLSAKRGTWLILIEWDKTGWLLGADWLFAVRNPG
jgi:hypothetical protein